MNLAARLTQAEAVGLVSVAARLPEVEYLFRHALVQDAAYNSLLRQERRRLHSLVGSTLEQLYAGQEDEQAAVLAHHFAAAGDDQRALRYYTQAGENAARRYAAPEALMHLSNALAVAGRCAAPTSALLRARGQAHDTLGDFTAALADYTAALAAAQVAGDQRAAWQLLLDLGFLWSARDYAQAGGYFQQAMTVAHTLDDPAVLGQTLNRIGNWYLNQEQPATAQQYHNKALEIFTQLSDKAGLAATYDLLGMTSLNNGNGAMGREYYGRALALFSELGHQQGRATVLAGMTLCGAAINSSWVQADPNGPPDLLPCAEEALALARAIHWRFGETFTLYCISLASTTVGNYSRSLLAGRQALEMALTLGHSQWLVAANYALGACYTDLLDFATACEHLEKALTLAYEIKSPLWIGECSGSLAQSCVAAGYLERAATVLTAVLSRRPAAPSLGGRLSMAAAAELALARRQPKRAIEIIEQIYATAHASMAGQPVARLELLRGPALAALGQPAQAAAAFATARTAAVATGHRSLLWRIDLAYGQFCCRQGQLEQGQAALADARQLIGELAAPLADPALRAGFLRQAQTMLQKAAGPAAR